MENHLTYMARESFRRIVFRGETLTLIDRCNQIIDDLQAQGYVLTTRQLFYQLVSRDIIQNKQSEYKRLGSIISDARLAGLVDWSAIEDRTRSLRSVSHWDDPSSIIESAADSYRIDKWATQKFRPEIWVEKDALVGVLEKACIPLDVPFFSCRGYTSQSELYGAGKRLLRYIKNEQEPVIIHLGDHDPSGVDMTRDISERLEMFVGAQIDVRRIALNMDQIVQYHPPPNPAKTTDARYEKYRQLHGVDSWELDALDPSVIDALIVKEVKKVRDNKLWKEATQRENESRTKLSSAASRWNDVETYLAATA